MVDDNVASFASCFRADDLFYRDDFCLEWALGPVGLSGIVDLSWYGENSRNSSLPPPADAVAAAPPFFQTGSHLVLPPPHCIEADDRGLVAALVLPIWLFGCIARRSVASSLS